MIHLVSSSCVILEYTFGTKYYEVNKIRIVLYLTHKIHLNFMLLETNDGIFLEEIAYDTLGIISIENLGVQNKYTIRFFKNPSQIILCVMLSRRKFHCVWITHCFEQYINNPCNEQLQISQDFWTHILGSVFLRP